MLARLCSVLFAFLLIHNLQAAGPQCFNYELYEHRNPGPIALNQSLINYGPLEIIGRHAAIPILGAAGAYPLGVSLMSHGMPPILWQHGVVPLVGGPLTAQQACRMAIDRQILGIDVNFRHQLAVASVAFGMPLPVAAGLAGMAPPAFLVYLNRALGGGGYFAHQATAIFRLRNNLPQPNFLWLGGPGVVIGPANCVVLHFHNTTRISKNLKELSYNSFTAPGVGGAVYV